MMTKKAYPLKCLKGKVAALPTFGCPRPACPRMEDCGDGWNSAPRFLTGHPRLDEEPYVMLVEYRYTPMRLLSSAREGSMPIAPTTLQAIETICSRLSERTATLFLGAGINAGVENAAGERFPLGQGLSDRIARDLLNTPDMASSLEEVAEMARFRLGDRELNRYLYESFSRFKPGVAHLALVQLPWDVIYSTNYDILVEKAAIAPSVVSAGVIQPIFSVHTDLTPFSEADILYYKLHGSIDYANTNEGRLILTKDDYRHYELHRKPLFRRLERDLLSRTFVFVGYSLRDSNFRAILEDCRNGLGTRTLPLSFAIKPHFSEVEEVFWREKYNIQLIAADADQFLIELKETWIAQNRSTVPATSRRSQEYLQVDPATRFQKVAESFYRIRPDDCTGSNTAKLFFRGAEPSWADIRDKVPPRREAYWTLLETIFPELADPHLPASIYLVTGAAGTGKTTLVRSIAYDLANEFDLPVLGHIPGTPLDVRFLSPLVDDRHPQRIIVVVRHVAEYVEALERFIDEAKEKSLPLTVIAEERKNQWNMASAMLRTRLAPGEFELGRLTQEEIESILDALAAHDSLGKLTGSAHDYQVEHFTALAHKELLVALRELTSEGSFDDIVRDEFDKVPSETAKQAYVYVAALGQIDLALRYETLINLLSLRYDQLGTEIFQPTEGVLISGEETGSSRHNAGFRLRSRHPVIASIIFDRVATDDEAKFQILNSILTHLDPGYIEDRRLLGDITRRKELVNTVASHDKRRAIYERLETILPNDPYVFQHRSILERELNNPELAVRYARQAVQMNKSNPAFLNTLGLALELEARVADDEPLRRQALISEALKLFADGIRRDRMDPYGHIGKLYILRQSISREKDSRRRALLQADALSLLEEAYEATGESPVIARQLALQREQLGTPDEAIAVLRAALERDPASTRLRDLWVQFEIEQHRYADALAIALEGTKYDPTSWRLQRHIARLKRELGDPIAAVKGHYEAAIRHHKGDVGLMVELGAYLFINGLYSEANGIFSQARNLPVIASERNKQRERWKDSTGNEIIFSGKVKSIRGAMAIAIAIPGNFEASFFRTHTKLSDLRMGDPIRFSVRFNAYGPVARIV